MSDSSTKIETNIWQQVPGANSIEIFPIIPKTNCVSSNCYIFSAPDALVVVDPGANPEQTRQINRVLAEALALSRRPIRSEEHTSELQSLRHLVCRLLLEK